MDKHPDIQYKSRAEIAEWQDARLRETIAYVATRSPFYRRLFADSGVDPASIRTVADLQRLPVTTKADLQAHGDDFLCVSPDDIIDYVTTSGTLGNPVTFALTESDLRRLAYNEELSFTTAGCSRSDVMQLMVTLDRRFMAGYAYQMGARELGMASCRVGNGIPDLQWDTINRLHSTCGMVVPSFLLKLIDHAERCGIDYRASSLRKCICIGEALRRPDGQFTALAQQIHDRWPELTLYTTYASTEMQASFTDCQCFAGGHLQPELIIVEFLGDDDKPVPPDAPGEVTITSIGVEGMPLVRFKTGDIVFHTDEPCGCGRCTTRLSSVIGRKGQMIKYKGTTLYPPAIFDILEGIPGVENYVVEVFTNNIGTDDITVRVGTPSPSDDFAKRIKDVFRAKVRVAPTVRFDDVQLIERISHPENSRKAVKFFDLRQ